MMFSSFPNGLISLNKKRSFSLPISLFHWLGLKKRYEFSIFLRFDSNLLYFLGSKIGFSITSNNVGTKKSSKEITFSISSLEIFKLVSKNNLVVWINDVVAWKPNNLNLGSISCLPFLKNKIDSSPFWTLANSELKRYSNGILELITFGILIWLLV